MPTPTTLLSFAAAALFLLLIPGPAVMYIVTRSAAQGRRAGLASVAGVHAGTSVHVAAAMVGLSAILVASATAFTVVKVAGAAYLVWMGIKSIRAGLTGTGEVTASALEARPLRRVFLDGAVLNILNPKTAIFFLAFVPQFVDPKTDHPALSVGLLGAVFIGIGLCSDSSYALAGGWVGERLRSSPQLQRRKDIVAGTTFIGLGAVTAFTGGAHRTA